MMRFLQPRNGEGDGMGSWEFDLGTRQGLGKVSCLRPRVTLLNRDLAQCRRLYVYPASQSLCSGSNWPFPKGRAAPSVLT